MKGRIYLVGAVVILLLLTNLGTVLLLTWPVTEFSIAKAGAFGDSFGWLNTVFSGLAFVGVVWTLAHQREELKDSRDTVRLDRFEGSFFRLLDLLRKNLEEIRIAAPDGGQPVYGVEALVHCSRKVREKMKEYDKWLVTANGRVVYERQLQQAARYMPTQARYLGTLETLLEIIERDLGDLEQREPYWDILAQQLTSGETKYLLLLTLRGKKPDRLSEHIVRAPPLLKRIGALSLSGSQKSLFKKIYGLSLVAPKVEFPPMLPNREYKSIRKKAVLELRDLAEQSDAKPSSGSS